MRADEERAKTRDEFDFFSNGGASDERSYLRGNALLIDSEFEEVEE